MAGESAIFQSEELGPEDRARETAVIQLRRAEGICRCDFKAQTGFDLASLLGERLGHYLSIGLLEELGEQIFLTNQGKCVADSIFADLL